MRLVAFACLAVCVAPTLGAPPVIQTLDGLRVSAEAAGDCAVLINVRPATPDDDQGAGGTVRTPDGVMLHVGGDGDLLTLHRDGHLLWAGSISRRAVFGRAGVPGLALRWRAAPGESIYGLGQRFNGFDQAGKVCEMWIRDAAAGGQHQTDSYFCTPVLYSSAGYGLFATDNPEGVFDLNSGRDGWHHYTRAGESLRFYLVVGDDLKDLVEQRAQLQGLPRGIPNWAWGPWISRNSYEVQQEAEDAIRGHVQRGWPVAAIVQEAWKGRSDTGAFNRFSAARWPALDDYFALCEEYGIRTLLWQVPVLHPTSPHFVKAEEDAYLVRDPDGATRLRSVWMRGFANIDFTNAGASAYWHDLLRAALRPGVAGFKADDGEDIEATDVLADGRRGWQVHNEYSVLYNRSLVALLNDAGVDGMLWARSGSLGIEQTPALWAGDQCTTWFHLRSLLSAGLSTSISGMPFWGHDIGGFYGTPSAELYVRWLQYGAFSPLMQYHGTTPREPWLIDGPDGWPVRAYDKLVKLRMALVPTLIELGREATQTGVPIMRPMIMEFPDDARFRREQSQYMLGPNILVAPIVHEGATGRVVRYPAGGWQHIEWPIAYDGPADYYVPAPVGTTGDQDCLPLVFVREGATLRVRSERATPPLAWTPDAPQREVAYAAERALVRNLSLPMAADPLDARLPVCFETSPTLEGWVRNADGGTPITEPGRRIVPTSDVWGIVTLQMGDRGQTTPNWDLRFLHRAELPVRLEVGSPVRRLPRTGSIDLTTILRNLHPAPLTTYVRSIRIAGVQVTPTQQEVTLRTGGVARQNWSLAGTSARQASSISAVFVACPEHDSLPPDAAFCLPSRIELAPDWHWAAVGPFDLPVELGHHAALGPEWETGADVAFEHDGRKLRWEAVPLQPEMPYPGVDFAALYGPRENAVAYAMARLTCGQNVDGELRFGSDDTLEVWLNGARVYGVEVYRAARVDQEIVPVTLNKGINTLVVKVAQGAGGWRFFARLRLLDDSRDSTVADGFEDFASYTRSRAPATRVIAPPKLPAWQVLGPLEPGGVADRALEQAADAGAAWPVDRPEANWHTAVPQNAAGLVDLHRVLGPAEETVAYATLPVTLSRRTKLEIVAGSDDGLTLWLAGHKWIDRRMPQPHAYDAHRVQVEVPRGTHDLVARITEYGGAWAYSIVIWDVTQTPHRLLGIANSPGDAHE
jgi:alpha-D-xyloside xylohydrolase